MSEEVKTTQSLETSLDVCRNCGCTLAYRTAPWKGGTVAFNGGGKLMDNSPIVWEPYNYDTGSEFCEVSAGSDTAYNASLYDASRIRHEGIAKSLIYSEGLSDGMRYRKANTWPKGTEAHEEYERGYRDGVNRQQANKRRKPRTKARGRGGR